jgi:hypothetical protein
MATHHQKPAIELTPKGAMVKLDKLYIYPDGHGNLTLRDGRNWQPRLARWRWKGPDHQVPLARGSMEGHGRP